MMDAYEDLFASGAGEAYKQKRELIKVSDLLEFKNHPFQVNDDADMDELVESIRVSGVMEPILVRPIKDRPGKYEIVAGHRRVNACYLSGITMVEAVVRDMTDEEAVAAMVDTNLFRRKRLLPSELTKALSMRAKAMDKLGKQESGIKRIIEKGLMTKSSVYRYISLGRLPGEMLEMIDKKRISVVAGEILAQLEPDVIDKIGEILRENPKIKINEAKARRLREEMSEAGDIERILTIKKKKTITLPKDITRLFPPETDTQEMIKEIIEALQKQRDEKIRKGRS